MAYSVRVGAYDFGTSSTSVKVPTGGGAPVAGDAMYIFIESSDSTTAAGTPTTPAGWTKLFEETQGAGGTGVTTLTIFGKIAGAGETNVTVSGVGDHCSSFMVVVGGHTLSTISNTLIGTGSGGNQGHTAQGSINSMACVANSVVIAAVAHGRDYRSKMNFETDKWFNSSLTNLTFVGDESTINNAGGGLGIVAGFATGTATGATTFETQYDNPWRAVHLAISATVPATTYSQPHFRIRTDDSQTLNADAGWAAAIDTNAALPVAKKFRLRFEVEGDSTGASTKFKLMYRRNGKIWQECKLWTFSTDEEKPSSTYEVNIAPSAQFLNGDATTNLLSGSGATFEAGEGREDNLTVAHTLISEHTEFEYTIRIPTGWGGSTSLQDMVHGFNLPNDTFEFRLVREDGGLFGSYVSPVVTLSWPEKLIGGCYIESPKNCFYGDTNGNLYFICEIAESANFLILLKSTDGGKRWFRQRGGLNEPQSSVSNDLESLDIDVLNGVMHIFSSDGSNNVYHRYHTTEAVANPDTWQITDEIIAQPTAGNDQSISGQVRSDGSCIAAFRQRGFDASNDDIMYATRPAGGGWTTPVKLDDTPSSNFTDVWLKVGANDTTHAFYFDKTGTTLWHKTIALDGTVSPRDAVATGLDSGASHEKPIAGVIYWDDNGQEKIMVGYIRIDNRVYTRVYAGSKIGVERPLSARRVAERPDRRKSVAFWDNNTINIQNQPGIVDYLESDDDLRSVITTGVAPNVGTEQQMSGTTVRNHSAPASSNQPFAHLANDEQGLFGTTTAYALYVDDVTADIFVDKSANGAAWGTDTEVIDAIDSTFVRGAIMQHSAENGGKLVYAFTYDEGLGFSDKISYGEFVTPGGLAVGTKIHTTDAVVLKTVKPTHTVDAVIFKTVTQTHTVDATIRIQPLRTHTTDATILKTQTRTHTVDATILRTFTLFHTMDAVIAPIAGNLRTHTTDAVILKTSTKTHTTDGIILKTSTKTHTVDAVISTTTIQTRVHTVDAVLRKTATLSHTVSAFIVPLLVPTPFTATVISSTRVDLSWGAVTGAAGYDIERNGVILVFRHGSTTFSDTTVVGGVTYTYRVRAVR